MSISLATRTAFGLSGEVRENVHFVDESLVVYPSAASLVVYNTETKTQKFVPNTPDTEGITAVAIASNRKFLAVAEKADDAVITIYDLQTYKKRKTLQTKQVESQEYACLAFSPDGKMLVSQGGAPEWTLIVWVWEKSKVVTTHKHPEKKAVVQVLFNPVDPNVISIVGHNVLKGLRLVDTSLKSMQPMLGKGREPGVCTCQCWLPDANNPEKEKLVVGTDIGEIMYFEGGELRAHISAFADNLSVDCIVYYSKGFIAGGYGGVLTLYEKLDDAPYFRKGKSFTIYEHPSRITNITITPLEESLICSLETNQMFILPLAQADILKTEEMNFEHMYQPFHAGPVTGMDTCIRKPLLATCSMDMSVRIWNIKDMGCELTKYFQDECYSVSMHPSGLHVLVGFADKLRVMNVLDNDIRHYAEFSIKACSECRFSNGGHMFAAVNGNTIQIYNTYTCENTGTLRGHNGKVKSLVWSADDLKLVSAGVDGAVYEWTIKDFKRTQESVMKGCSYTCVYGWGEGADGRTLAVGNDNMVKEFLDPLVLNKEVGTGDAVLTQIAMSSNQKLMFASTDHGALRAYRYPMVEDEYVELQAHMKPITRIAVSADDTMLFTTSEDGTLCVHTVRDRDTKSHKKEGGITPWGEEVLVSKSELEERKSHTLDLETQVSELTKQNEMQLHLKDLDHKAKIEEMVERFQSEKSQDQHRYQELATQQSQSSAVFQKQLEEVEVKHQNHLSELESQFQQKIMNELERYTALQVDKEALNDKWDEQNSMLMDSHERVIQELTEEYEHKLSVGAGDLNQVHLERAEQMREFEETKFQLEEDADREIEQTKEGYEKRLKMEREVGLRLKGENGIMKKKFHALSKDIKGQEDEIKELNNQKSQLYVQISNLEKEIVSLKKEVTERDETIGDKEKRIYDIKKKNQELEKFKFVLDFKIKEMKKQIEPREAELARVKDQIKSMDEELERYHAHSGKLNLKLKSLNEKADGMQNENLLQRRLNQELTTHLSHVNTHINEVAAAIQDPKKLKEKAKKLYEATVRDQLMTKTTISEIEEENKKQRDYLERTVQSLKRKLAKDMEMHRIDNRKILHENILLMREINELRRDVKVLQLDKEKAKADMFANGVDEYGNSIRGRSPKGSLGRLDSRNGSTHRSLDGGVSSRDSARPLTQQFGPAPRWGEPRLPPRPFTGMLVHERALSDKDAEIERLHEYIRSLESRVGTSEQVSAVEDRSDSGLGSDRDQRPRLLHDI